MLKRIGFVMVVCALLALTGCSASSKAENGARDANANGQQPPSGSAGSAGVSAFDPSAGAGGNGGASGMGQGSFNTAGTGGTSAFGNPAGSAGDGGGAGASASGDSAQEPLPGNEDEPHTSVGVNPFVLVEHDPFSTFAADVDTASYDLMRRDVSAGFSPVPEGVRLEDFVNYFKYDYPAPADDAEHPFEISLAAAPHPVREGITLLRVGIQATLPAEFVKKPANLVFLIDTSGSMQSADKLPLVQSTLTQALTVLDPNDTVSIVSYAGDVNVRLPPTHVLEASTIAAAINGLASAGGTNGAGGIQLAYQQAESAFIEGGINHIVLCTDGDFNIGVASDEALVELVTEKRKTGVTLTALGYGIGNLNDSMMEKVSNAGNGMYSLITSEQQATNYVENRLLSTIEHVAKDVKIQLELNPAHVLAYRLLGYENRAIADHDFRDDAIDAGEIGAGHRVTALYELVMAGGTVPDVASAPAVQDGEPVGGQREITEDALVLVKVRYKQPGAAEADNAVEVQRTLAPELSLASLDEADADMKWAVAMAMFAELLKNSPYASTPDLAAVQSLTTAQATRDDDRAELVSLLASYSSQQP